MFKTIKSFLFGSDVPVERKRPFTRSVVVKSGTLTTHYTLHLNYIYDKQQFDHISQMDGVQYVGKDSIYSIFMVLGVAFDHQSVIEAVQEYCEESAPVINPADQDEVDEEIA